jgi:hypothetical protein
MKLQNVTDTVGLFAKCVGKGTRRPRSGLMNNPKGAPEKRDRNKPTVSVTDTTHEWKRRHPNRPPNSWKSAQEKFSGLRKRLPLRQQAKSPEEEMRELKEAAERFGPSPEHFGPSQYPVDPRRFRRRS